MQLCVRYKPSFVRDFKKLPTPVREEALQKIAEFQDVSNQNRLKVHKLKGRLRGYYSFSVTYAHRIVFAYEDAGTVVFLAVGDHDVYNG